MHATVATSFFFFVEAYIKNISRKFQLHSPDGFWRKDFFLYIILQISRFRCHDNIKFRDWTNFICNIWLITEDFWRNIFVKLLSKYLQWDRKKTYFHFSHYKPVEIFSCYSNESIKATVIKNNFFVEANFIFVEANIMNISWKI